ncbi:hypothetical protein HYDPIDRAFT_27990 [Hydnomerulius pinastri MD-312]|uniref:Uncharacterized protein n=1 Tax=Hydnomerulius pinastri MD-312 TaxID=994086 RepID=A0A0C9WB37_9AGAM|nr:hypothetical protein HYDPIDRAFT_27990 [Hydnomerulius pinastri MD-312]
MSSLTNTNASTIFLAAAEQAAALIIATINGLRTSGPNERDWTSAVDVLNAQVEWIQASYVSGVRVPITLILADIHMFGMSTVRERRQWPAFHKIFDNTISDEVRAHPWYCNDRTSRG